MQNIAILRALRLAVVTFVVIVHQHMEQLHVVLMAVMDRIKSHVLQMDVVIVPLDMDLLHVQQLVVMDRHQALALLTDAEIVHQHMVQHLAIL